MHAVPQKVAEMPRETARRRLRKRDRVYTRNDDAGDVAHMDRGLRKPIYLVKPRPFEPARRNVYARRAQKSGQNATRNRPQKAAKRNRVHTRNVDAGDVSRVSGGPREPIYLLKPRPFEPTHRGVYARHAQKMAEMSQETACRRLRKGVAYIRATSTAETSLTHHLRIY